MRRHGRGGRVFGRPVLPGGQHVLQAHGGVLPVRAGLPVRPTLEPPASTWCHTRHTAHPLITLPAPLIAPPHRSQDGALGPVRWDRVRREQVLPVRRQLHRAEPRLFAVRASEAARRYRGHVWCVVRPGPRFRRHVHHGPVDAVRRQVLHGRQLLPEGVLVHLPHRGLLAMRALTRTRRFMSSRQWSGPPSRRACTGLRCGWCALRPCTELYCRVVLSCYI